MNKTVPIDQCPDPSVHGSPFRYCPYCEWREPQEPKPVTVRPNPNDAAQVETVARALSAHWRDMHTNESLGRQRMLAIAALEALAGAL